MNADGRVQWRAVKRRLFTILSALSLLLCVAVVVLWVRRTTECLEVTTRGGAYWQLYSSRCLGIMRVGHWPEPPRVAYMTVSPSAQRDVPVIIMSGWGLAKPERGDLFGLGIVSGELLVLVDDEGSVLRGPPFPEITLVSQAPLSSPLPFWRVDVPYWMVLIAFGSLPIWRLSGVAMRFLIGRSRNRRRLCPCCGYDLRATPGRCPECGTAAAVTGEERVK